MSGCPICGDYRDDGLCPRCVQEGYDEAMCGCLLLHRRVIRPCSPDHTLCEQCQENRRERGHDLCGPCEIDEEREANPDSFEWHARR